MRGSRGQKGVSTEGRRAARAAERSSTAIVRKKQAPGLRKTMEESGVYVSLPHIRD
jgi:hypothetical protein